MKRIILIIFICILTNSVCSQNRFNVIVEDTISHITNSIYAVDTGYILMSGSRNNFGIRCFAISYIDLYGKKIWKKVYGDSEIEFWEGRNNSLKNESFPYSVITTQDTNAGLMGIRIITYDNSCNLNLTKNLYSGNDWKAGFNIIRTQSKCFFITGAEYDSALDDIYMYLIKTDSLGNHLWNKSYGQRNETGEQIIETSDENLLIGGKTFSFPTGVTDEDWYLIKVDTAGNVIWEDGFGRPGFLNYDGPVRGLIETSDSNYVACGGYPAFKSATDTYWDGCLRKVSKDGDLLWEKFFRTFSTYTEGNTTMYENLKGLYEDNNGDIIIVSSTYDSKPFYRGCLTKVNQNGEIIYRRIYYAIDIYSNEQYLTAVKPTPDGGVILAGYGNTYDWYDYDPPQQAWLVKTDSLGLDGLCYTEAPELNFDIEFPTMLCRNDTMQVLAYIAGKSAPYTIEFSTGQVVDSIYYPPLFVPVEIGLSTAEVEYGGEIIYSQEITEATLSNHAWGQCIAKPIEFYTPQFQGTHSVDITVTDAYGESKTITKMFYVQNCDDAIETENVCPVKLYPNPARNKVYLDIPEDVLPETAEVYNSGGQLVKTVNVHKGLNVVNVSELASGNYILKVATKDETFSLSFEKE